jgi:tetratricopeptide (TPR) repeat protein
MADLEIAEKLDGEYASKVRNTVEAELARNRVEGPTEMLLSDLEQSAKSDAPMETLIDKAVSVHKAMAPNRLRYDEWYQDKLRILEAEVRANPKDPDRLVALAKHIADESNLRGLFAEPGPGLVGLISGSAGSYIPNYPTVGDELNFRAERVEPGSPLLHYRWQESEAKETAIALDYLDQAIALDPNHARAIILEAFILDRKIHMILDSSNEQYLGDWRDKVSAEKAHSIALKDPELKALSAWLFTQVSPAQGGSSSATSQEVMEAAKGTYLGHLIQAYNHYVAEDPASAEESLRKALEMDPETSDAHEQLLALFVLLGDAEEATSARVAAVNTRYQTTAAVMLDIAVVQINSTAWQGAKQGLAAARALDPTDARAPAYMAVVHAGEGRLAESEAAFRTAIALEEARLRLDDLSVVSGDVLTRDPQDFGLVAQLRLMLANLYVSSGRPSEALDQYRVITSYMLRFSPSWQSRQLFTAMLPDPTAPQDTLPSAGNATTLIAASHFGAGQLLSTMGEVQAGLEEFRAAVALGPTAGMPNVGGVGGTNFAGHAQTPAGDALVELAKAAMNSGQYDLAQEYLQYVGYFSLSDAARNEVNEIQIALSRVLTQQTEQSQGPFAGLDLEQRRMAEEQQQRELEQIRQLIDQLPLDARLVGVWEMKAQTQFAPGATLTIDADRRFMLVSQTDGAGRQGRLGVMGPQLMMLADDGRVEVHLYEAPTNDHLVFTSMTDGFKYDLNRRR